MDGKLLTALMVIALIICSAFLLVGTIYQSTTQGELTNMTHGHPDFHRTGGTKTSYPVNDFGELAARLGSVDTFDRRGDVLFIEDFEGEYNKFQDSTTGTGATISRTTTSSRGGNFALQMITGNAIGNTAEINHYMPAFDDQRMGFEASISTFANLSEFNLYMRWRDGTTEDTAALRHDLASSKFQIRVLGGSWVDILTGIDLDATSGLFHNVKIVADYKTKQYVRAIIDGTEYELSDYALYTAASASDPRLKLTIDVTNGAVGNRGIVVDDLIVTMNEP